MARRAYYLNSNTYFTIHHKIKTLFNVFLVHHMILERYFIVLYLLIALHMQKKFIHTLLIEDENMFYVH